MIPVTWGSTASGLRNSKVRTVQQGFKDGRDGFSYVTNVFVAWGDEIVKVGSIASLSPQRKLLVSKMICKVFFRPRRPGSLEKCDMVWASIELPILTTRNITTTFY